MDEKKVPEMMSLLLRKEVDIFWSSLPSPFFLIHFRSRGREPFQNETLRSGSIHLIISEIIPSVFCVEKKTCFKTGMGLNPDKLSIYVCQQGPSFEGVPFLFL